MKGPQDGTRRILQVVFALGFVNFLVFWFGAVYLGGDAISGKAVDGHYFLSSHGHLTEVSQRVFDYSKWHTRSVSVTHPLAMFCGWLLSRRPDSHTGASPKEVTPQRSSRPIL
jgi:hypothetical protein